MIVSTHSSLSLLYGLLIQGEAYLMTAWLMPEQRLAQVKITRSINQSISDKEASISNANLIYTLQLHVSFAHLNDTCNRHRA